MIFKISSINLGSFSYKIKGGSIVIISNFKFVFFKKFKASAIITFDFSSISNRFIFFLIYLIDSFDLSTKKDNLAPKLIASIPKDPDPAKRSKKTASSI